MNEQERPKAVLAMGNFDGVHRGHRAVLAAAEQLAAEQDALPAALTFTRTPLAALRPAEYAGDLLSLTEKIRALEAAGAKEIVLLRPTREVLSQTPEEFLAQLRTRYAVRGFVVGENFRFGAAAAGDADFLVRYGRREGIPVSVVALAGEDGGAISSTAIRRALLRGDVATATRLLGRYWSLAGTVLAGAARGRTIGFPTANMALPRGRVAPANGVYATFAEHDGRCYPAVTNVGTNPTFGAVEKRLETHIMDFGKRIYGENLRTYFVAYLRQETKFASLEALRAQIAADVRAAQEILRHAPLPGEE